MAKADFEGVIRLDDKTRAWLDSLREEVGERYEALELRVERLEQREVGIRFDRMHAQVQEAKLRGDWVQADRLELEMAKLPWPRDDATSSDQGLVADE